MSILLSIIVLVIFAAIGAIFGDYIKRIRPILYGVFALFLGGIGIAFAAWYEDFMFWIQGANKYDPDSPYFGDTTYMSQSLNFAVAFFIISILLFGFCWISSIYRNEDKEKEKKNNDVKIANELRNKKEIEYKNELELISKEYGKITNKIELRENSKDNCILIFAETKKIWILGKTYDFKDIIGCSLSDNSHIEKGKVTYETKTSTGSMLGRAVVGGVLTGGVGAVIGGATAKKNTVAVPQGYDKVIHDYTVLVNINSLTTPIVRISCGSNGGKVNDIVAIMNVIIRQNNN